MKQIFQLLLGGVLLAGFCSAQPTIQATASSEMKDPKVKYGAAQAIDGDLLTWWTPAPPNNDGKGSWLKISFGDQKKVSAIKIIGGSHYPNYPGLGNLFPLNARLKQASVEFEDGNSEPILLNDEDAYQVFGFPKPHRSSYIILKPVSIYPGKKWQDLCISDIQIVFEAGGENENALAWMSHMEDVLGVWTENGLCSNMICVLKRNREDGSQLPLYKLEIPGVMDMMEDAEITFAEKDDRGIVTLTYTSFTSIARRVVLGDTYQQIVKGSYSYEQVAPAYTHTFLVGEYRNEKGEPIIITENGISRGGKTFSYKFEHPPSMYSTCGTIDFGDGQLAIILKGQDIYLHKILFDDDGPGFNVEKTPYRVYYRVK